MFTPETHSAPQKTVFEEPWHAQVLALAETMVAAKYFSAAQWADALGAALRQEEADSTSGDATSETAYFLAALKALETLSNDTADISIPQQNTRKLAWESAYKRTLHGEPVELQSGD